jgi:L-asparaginase II
MNCSGKHAGFLATCQHSEWDLGSYLSASHPLQSLILETIGDYAAETPSFSSVDGCGSPLHALSVGALARAFARVGAGETAHEQQLLHAVKDNSWALDGEGRDNTVTIDTIGGIAKIGAEGLVAMTTPEGVGVAVKILDGSMRATTLVALSALASVGAISDRAHTRLAEVLAVPVTGGEATIGGLRATI